ncbi:RagB/SusD family nutrient uptake outer membrane protein [Pseudoflavitalea rhizosphaerae]|uniref:RagB/SusD family nutrient uptake outer membrane protein n=1 Tax=Pseudoflavitalea rhizosphaerae TaxID=1884793 RepID=UPI0013DF1241|nr:RagB/SusD family nutrient uptake outer membrane protein [Pseudoflavitalea rhizosphaerae]
MKKLCYILSVAVIFLLTLSSCKKWMDVQPKISIKSDVLLRTEQGYRDALIGCYTLMKNQQLYARELTFGFVDAAAQQYDTYNNAVYNDVARWNYTAVASVRSKIDGIWSGMYNVLANVNNILDNIDSDKSIFTNGNYEIIKGEALAIRAFLHLDLLRLFASSDLALKAIPYIKTLSTKVIGSSNGNEVIGLILQDAAAAAELLKDDPIKSGNKYIYSQDEFMNNRHQRLNYYACKAIAARAYLWSGKKVEALAKAREVMQDADRLFPWIQSADISATSERDKDYTFSTENLFALNVHDLKNISNTWFMAALPNNLLFRGSYYYEEMFEKNSIGANDYRLLFTSRLSGWDYVLYKYYQPDNYKPAYAGMVPLFRRSEMNYIAAECLIGVNNEEAIELLNEVRRHRGITVDLDHSLPNTEITAEILKEYRKEFQGEGQLFYYCKRNKLANFPDGYQTVTDKEYVLPKPENEIEFGQ